MVVRVSPNESSASVVVAITGGNTGCGWEAARQLSSVSEVAKVVITARSPEKADAAISKLIQETGKDKSFFDFVILDLSDFNSIKTAVASFPDVDRLCLNAGGFGFDGMHSSGNGMTDCVVINSMGHAVLVDGLIQAKKIKAGSRVVYVGSEIARALWGFVPLNPNYCGNFKEKDIDWAISTPYDGIGSCLPVRKQLGNYKNAKIIDSMKIGAKRYVDVLTGEPKWTTGAMPMSGKEPCGCCLYGGSGKMIDNRPLVKYFKDEELCEKTVTKVREWTKKWEAVAPSQQSMKCDTFVGP